MNQIFPEHGNTKSIDRCISTVPEHFYLTVILYNGQWFLRLERIEKLKY